MRVVADERNILVSLQRGERVVESLIKVAQKSKLGSATFSGIGAVTNVTLGFYDLPAKTYLKRHFPETYELVSCLGNITMNEGSPFVHAHIAISGRGYQTYGGHLFEATIAVVGEISIWPLGKPIHRKYDRDVGLAVWNLEECGDVE